ncbi:MAG: hypothetical protein FWG75_03610 [Cystobacterineae bacterium]|nr:hypothetical protein [Cystobacterineae bacterium]
MFFQSMLVFFCLAHGHSHEAFSPQTKALYEDFASSSAALLQKNIKPPSGENQRSGAALVSRRFLTQLLRNDWDEILSLAAFPFWLESKTYSFPIALRVAWEKQLSQKRLANYEIRGIEVFSFEQMKERFGPPPERLKQLLSNRRNHWFAVANISGKAAILVLQPSTLKVVAFHD